MGLVPRDMTAWSQDAGTLTEGAGLRPSPGARGFKGITSFKAHSHPGRELLLFSSFEAPRPMEMVKYCGQGWSPWSAMELTRAHAVRLPPVSAQPTEVLLEAFWGILVCFKYSSVIHIQFTYHTVHLGSVYSSVVFSVFTKLCSHHHNQF